MCAMFSHLDGHMLDPWLLQGPDSEPLPGAFDRLARVEMTTSDDFRRQVIDVVGDIGREKWHEIGGSLGFSVPQLSEYRRYESLESRLSRLIYDWTCKHETPVTVGQLVDVCYEVGIGGEVQRRLTRQFDPRDQ